MNAILHRIEAIVRYLNETHESAQSEVEKERDELRQAMQTAECKKRHAQSRAMIAEAELEEVRKKLETSHSLKESYMEENRVLQERVANVDNEVVNLEVELRRERKRIIALSEALNSTSSQLDDANKRANDAEALLSQAYKALPGWTVRSGTLVEEIQKLSTSWKTAERNLQALQQCVDASHKNLTRRT